MHVYGSRSAGRGLLLRVVVAHLKGQSAEDFGKEQYRAMCCPWCADGWDVTKDGNHDIMGVIVDCDAAGESCR